VVYAERERVTPLEATTVEAFAAMKQIGRDSLDLVKGTKPDATNA
jgi:hypothetical protein